MIRAIKNHIIFEFHDEVRNGCFLEKFNSGIIIPTVGAEGHVSEQSSKYARVGKIISVGPEVIDKFKIGMDVLITHLMWTESFSHNGQDLWRTDDSKILAICTNCK